MGSHFCIVATITPLPKPVLSLKTPDEILTAKFPEDHFFFNNRL